MAVQMDKPSELSSRERAQRLYNKSVELDNARRKPAYARGPYDTNAWQQIRENYESIILEDHSFAEQHEIELALWQLHYRRIEELRAAYNAALSPNAASPVQNGKGGPTHPDRLARIRSQFKTFLSEATGFYHELMLKIRAKYGLPLGYFSDDPENQIILSKDGHKTTDVKKGLISCHRCLIYLGDLARYKGLYGDGESKNQDFAAASSYYMQAASLWPSSGNPHHQLAIVAAYHGDGFGATYRYFRSLAVESPFSTARDNLIIAFERNRQNYLQLLEDTKTSTNKVANPVMNGKGRGRGEARALRKDSRSQPSPKKEKGPNIPETFIAFCVKFVRVNGILFTRTSLETFVDVLSMAKNDLILLLSAGSEEQYNFGSDAAECGLVIVRLVAILIFTVHNVNRESENQSYAEILQRPILLQNAYTAVFELMGLVVERCSQLNDPLSSFLLPGVLVFVEWLACYPDVATGSELGEKQADSRLFFWKSCIAFFNKLLASGFISDDADETCFFNMSKYEEGETENQFALWEDFELRGFLPLHPAQQILDFSRKQSFGSDGGVKEKKIRVQRIIAAGKAFTEVVRVGEQGIYFDSNLKKFVLGAHPQYSLSSNAEMLMMNVTCQELPTEKSISVGVPEPAAKIVDVEDEEEEIVFKPSATDKQADTAFPALPSHEDFGLGANLSDRDLGGYAHSVSTAPNGTLVENGFGTTSRPSTFIPSAISGQSVQLNSSGWLVEQQASMMNGFKNFGLMDDVYTINQEPPPPKNLTTLKSAALSLPFPHSVNFNTGNGYSAQVSEDVMPSKTDSVISSGIDVNIYPLKSQSMSPAFSKKSPVSRPNRHAGPPPGFTPAASKYNGHFQPWSSMKDENPIMDDYSWLDGYQTPSTVKQDNGINTGFTLNGTSFNHVDKSTEMLGAISFPFPGKQASAFQFPSESHKLWQDNRFSDHLKLYGGQQQQKVKQQTMSLPEQFHGQSMWGSRFLV